VSECPDVKNYKWWLKTVWHTMVYGCTHMATVVDVKWSMAHQHNYAIQCHSRWFTLKKYGTEDKLKIPT